MDAGDFAVTDVDQDRPEDRPEGTRPPARRELMRVNPKLLISPEERAFDLFVIRGERTMLYLPAGTPFTQSSFEDLQRGELSELYIRVEDREEFLRLTEARILSMVTGTSLPMENRARLLYDMAATVVKDTLARPPTSREIQRSVRLAGRIQQFITQSDNALATLVTMPRFEEYLHTHAINTCIFGIGVGFTMGLSGDDLHALATGCLLMDVGKLAIPDYILKKKGRLSGNEWVVMRRHPIQGFEMIRDAGGLPNEDAFIPVLQHHERLDGSGYPDRLTGDAIHLFGRIAGLVDVYDAMTKHRSYASAMRTFPALKTIRDEMTGLIDPEVFKHLVLLLKG